MENQNGSENLTPVAPQVIPTKKWYRHKGVIAIFVLTILACGLIWLYKRQNPYIDTSAGYVKGEIVVILEPNADRLQFDQFVKSNNLKISSEIPQIHVIGLRVPNDQEVKYMNLIRKLSGVQSAELDFYSHAD